MARPFTLEDRIHAGDDRHCPQCGGDYPQPCPCGGLIHGAVTAEGEDVDVVTTTRCDRCGRSEEEALGEEVA